MLPSNQLASRTDDGVPVGLDVVLADNSDFNNAEPGGGWLWGAIGSERWGYDAHVTNPGSGEDTFTWNLHVPTDGDYEVFAYQNDGATATDAPYTVTDADGEDVVRVDQTANGGEWVSLGSYAFTGGGTHDVTLSDDANGNVVADAVKLVRDNSDDTPRQPKDFTYDYDPNGNLTTIADASPSARVDSYRIAYDGINQVSKVEELTGATVANTSTFAYNANGAVTVAGHDKQHAEYEYDTRDLVSEVTNGTSPDDPDPDVTTFSYTTTKQRATQVKPNGNTVESEYYRDHLERSQTETKPDGTTVVSSHELAYDPNGNRTQDAATMMNADDGSAMNTTSDYTYDPRDRVAEVTKTGDGAGSESYTHDANNNVISQTIDGTTTNYNYDRNRLLTADIGGVAASYNYDPFGRLDTVTSAGEVIERNIYDGFDQLVEHRSMDDTGATTTTEYTYDPLERTSTKTTDAGTAEEETTTFNYLGTSSEVLDEEVAGEVTKSYQYSPWGERLSQITHNDEGEGDDEAGYYGYNPHTDVEQLTDENGDTESTYGYTAYGNNDEDLFTGHDKPDPGNPADTEPYNVYRYNAKRWDQGTGNYDMGFRNYDPGLNRFLTRDQYNGALNDMGLSTSPFTGNRYAYGAGNPITMIEHDGHIPAECGGGGWDCDRAEDGGWSATPAEGNTGMYPDQAAIDEAIHYAGSEEDLLAEVGSMVTRCAEHGLASDLCNDLRVAHEVDPDITTKRRVAYFLLHEGLANGMLDMSAGTDKGIMPSYCEPSCLQDQTAGALLTGSADTRLDTAIVIGFSPTGPINMVYAGGRSAFAGAAASSTSGLCSFSSETEVVMADGTTKPISEIAVGDWVLAEDPETGERGARRVTQVWVHGDELIDLEVDGEAITTTEDHPFWNHTDQSWQAAQDLDSGDLILTADGDHLPVDGLDPNTTQHGLAYNLTVNDIHTYYVTVGDEEALVHNEGCGGRSLLHSAESLKGTSSYNHWSKQSTSQIKDSLNPSGNSPLVVNQRGTIMDGNTRALILRERGVSIDSLPAVSRYSGFLPPP